jgi:uncharacterized protein (DUF2249 family)
MAAPRLTQKISIGREPAQDTNVSAGAVSPPEWVRTLDSAAAANLDVRPILAEGEDPFTKIMAIVTKLAPGAALVLEAPFDPSPLRRLLAGKGFAEHAECPAPGHWRVYFRKPQESCAEASPASDGARIWRESEAAHIDVRGLEAPEPMLVILRLLERPDCATSVIVHHEREPLFLYPELAERGWRHEVLASEPGEVRLRLTRMA